MTTRKVIHPLSPTTTSSTVRALTSAMATEYAEAIQTLNEPTMKQACEWLLDDTEESEDKLLETYYKCESAWKVLQRQQHLSLSHQHLLTPLSPLPPGAPNLSLSAMSSNNSNNNSSTNNNNTNIGTLGGRTALQPRPLPKLGLGSVTATTGVGATAAAVSASSTNPTTTSVGGGTNSNSNSTMKVAKGGVIPMRRTAPMPKLSRMRSTEASSSSDALDALPNKKQRPDNARAPPPSALHFLAKLNKDAPGTTSTTGPSISGPALPTTITTTSTTTTPNTTPRNFPPMKGQHHRRTSS